MIHSIGVKELATEKTLSVDPTDLGVRIFMYNKALEERMHIELDLEDMIDVNRVLQKRIRDLECVRSESMNEMCKVIRWLANGDSLVVNNNIDYECPFCNSAASLREDFMHSATCIVTKARELATEIEKGN